MLGLWRVSNSIVSWYVYEVCIFWKYLTLHIAYIYKQKWFFKRVSHFMFIYTQMKNTFISLLLISLYTWNWDWTTPFLKSIYLVVRELKKQCLIKTCLYTIEILFKLICKKYCFCIVGEIFYLFIVIQLLIAWAIG